MSEATAPAKPDTPAAPPRGARVSLARVRRVFGEGEVAVSALDGVDLEIEPGSFVVLLGPSGSGKTTLLNVVGAIDQPTSGDVTVDGVELSRLDREQRTTFRRDHVGFVFQFFNLVPTLTALENVRVVAELTGHHRPGLSEAVLRDVGLGDKLDRFPAGLSGGEQQRVALGRALAKEPTLLLCDEPTGALDLDTGRQALGLIREVSRDRGVTVVLVTHNSVIAQMADRVLHLRDGRIVDDELVGAPLDAGQLEW